MRAFCPTPILAGHCQRLGLPFHELMGARVALGCPLCHPFDHTTEVVWQLDEMGEWTGRCVGCDHQAWQLVERMRLEVSNKRMRPVAR